MNTFDLESKFGVEVKKVLDYYADNHLRNKKKVTSDLIIDLEKFIFIIGHRISCIVNEIKTRIGTKPGKRLPRSVFLPDNENEKKLLSKKSK